MKGWKKMKFLKITLLLVSLSIYCMPQLATAGEMSEYCYLPPFVTDANTPPNIMLVYEKGPAILRRAYTSTYSSGNTYYGFFTSNANYTYDASNNYFYKNTCTPSSSNLNCIQGNYLNWATMSSIDLSRKVLVGFGWPDVGASTGAGQIYTYSGNFVGGRAPVSYGQWQDGNSANVSTLISIGGTDYSFIFCLSKFTGSNPTGLSIRAKLGQASLSCSGGSGVTNVVSSGRVAMKFTDENRVGLIQKYSDKDKNYMYDTDGVRFGTRRWHTGNDKQADVVRDTPLLTSAERETYFRNLLTAVSKAPPDDTSTAYLDSMMRDVVTYFRGESASFIDNDAYSQTPYNWATDPAKTCRKTYVLYLTTGEFLNNTSSAPLSASCSLDIADKSANFTDFSKNTCYAYSTDLYTGDAAQQNIKTYILQTIFSADDIDDANANQPILEYASVFVGGGMFFSVKDPAKFESELEQALLNIIASSSSASTVATLTSQTRESSTLTQAYFYPQIEDSALRWIGYLRLLWSDPSANVREETLNAGWLDLKTDKILSFYYDSAEIAYKARTYQSDANFPYLRIANCDPDASGNNTKDNRLITAIWNAQEKLESRTTDDRVIKIGIGDTGGNVTGSTCSSNAGFCNFTTALNATLQPFWNAAGYCSNNVSRWCAGNSNCNYCTANSTTRFCPAGTNAECSYCSGNPAASCVDTADCFFDYGTCNTASLICSDESGAACTILDAPCGIEGTCKGACTVDTTRLCAISSECTDNFGDCSADTCTVANGTTVKCNQECDHDCATSVIKFIRGHDKPTPSGGDYRVRHECTSDSSCLSGTCLTDKTCSLFDNLKTLKLGDVVYSTPRISPNTYINGYTSMYKDETYKKFIENTISSVTPIAIVGGNDGMVHAFKVGKIKDLLNSTIDGGYQIARFSDDPSSVIESAPPDDIGKELWGYIPYNVVPFLKWYCAKGYCHIPMLDARFTVMDASINAAGPTETKAADGSTWKRLLIGAMGAGGKAITLGSTTLSSSVFVLDITDPTNPVLLWEKPLPDRSLTTSVPAIVRLAGDTSEASKNESGSWYVIIGSGPKSILTNGVTYTTDPVKLYVFNLKTGVLAATIPVIDTSGVAVGDMMAVDFDSDYQVDDIYFGTYGGTGTSQTGKLYRLRLRNGESAYQINPASWTISTAVDAGRPIYASAEVALDSDQNAWLYFGTGLYLTQEHASATTDNEWIYGFKEKKDCWKGTGTCGTYGSFLDTTNITMSGAKASELACFCGGTQMSTAMCDPPGIGCPDPSGLCGANKACSNNLSKTCSAAEDCPEGTCIDNVVVLKVTDATLNGLTACDGKKDKEAISCLESQIKMLNGWKRAVSGQKFFAKPFVAGGLVDFTAYKPTSSSCGLGGSTYLFSLHYTTGTPYVQPTIAMHDATTTNYQSLTLNPYVELGTGVPPLGESLVALPLAGDAFKVITQVSGGLPGITMAPSLGASSGYILWRSK